MYLLQNNNKPFEREVINNENKHVTPKQNKFPQIKNKKHGRKKYYKFSFFIISLLSSSQIYKLL